MKNEVRIIGGTWRSRKLKFPDAPGLRPTPNRVRETLFNWLGQDLEGQTCLDLFAGSGALGFEAASRGARRVIMVEQDAHVARALKANCEMLDARQIFVIPMDACQYLRGTSEHFDIVFLDPPFRNATLPPICRALELGGWLAAGARIYLESERDGELEGLPEDWQLLRAKQAGEVDFQVYRR